MKIRFVYFSGLLVLMMFATSCASIITENDNGQTIELAIDSEFQVQLKGTGQEGFEWRLVGRNHEVFRQIGEPEIENAGSSGEIKTYTFTFKTIGAGDAILRMIYYDKTAEDPKPEKEFELRIISGTMGQIEG